MLQVSCFSNQCGDFPRLQLSNLSHPISPSIQKASQDLVKGQVCPIQKQSEVWIWDLKLPQLWDKR